MKRIIFAIHGVRSGKKGNWVYDFTDFAKKDPRFVGDVFVPHWYGRLYATLAMVPFIKYTRVKRLKKVLREIISENPGYELNIVAHSYGTELSFQAIKTSGEDGGSFIKANKLILVSGIVSRHREIPYTDTLRAEKIKELHCYCSYEDEVCRFLNPIGRCGYSGFSKDKYDSKCYPKPIDDLEIYNHQVEILEHSDYFKETEYYKEWLDIIDKKTQ